MKFKALAAVMLTFVFAASAQATVTDLPLTVPSSGTYTGTGGHLGRTVTDATSNFGMEVWVNAANTNNATFAYNGDASDSGFGLGTWEGNYIGWYGGIYGWNIAPVDPDVWHVLALVNVGGTTFTYFDGTLQSSFESWLRPAGSGTVPAMTVGENTADGGLFSGSLNGLRVFTFNEGEFNAATDLTSPSQAAPVPEAASIALVGVGLAALTVFRRRKAP